MNKTSTPRAASPVSTAAKVIKTRAARTPKGIVAALLADAPKVPEVAATPAPAAEVAPVVPPVGKFGIVPTQDGLRLTHAIKDGFRPGSGAALFAHTSVFLTHAGLDKTPMPSAMVDTFIGARAIAYHTSKGNFAKVADTRNAKGELIQRGGIVLTQQGIDLFAKRRPDAELASAFENVLCRGELDERTGLKNATGIVQVAAK